MKQFVKATLLGGILGMSLALPTVSQELEVWGTAGGWDVLIDPSLGDGCLIQAEYEDGSLVRIGFDRNKGTGYVASFNDNWGDIIEGKTYSILFDLDGQEYDGEAIGIYVNGVPGADVNFTNPDFLFDIAQKYTMTLYSEDGEVMAIDLGGTSIGLEAVIQCQEELG